MFPFDESKNTDAEREVPWKLDFFLPGQVILQEVRLGISRIETLWSQMLYGRVCPSVMAVPCRSGITTSTTTTTVRTPYLRPSVLSQAHLPREDWLTVGEGERGIRRRRRRRKRRKRRRRNRRTSKEASKQASKQVSKQAASKIETEQAEAGEERTRNTVKEPLTSSQEQSRAADTKKFKWNILHPCSSWLRQRGWWWNQLEVVPPYDGLALIVITWWSHKTIGHIAQCSSSDEKHHPATFPP